MTEYKDIAFLCDPVTGEIDISLNSDGSDLARDNSLRTAVLISLFTDARVSERDLPALETDRKGWFGDLIADVTGDKIGSTLWTIKRDKTTLDLVPKIETAARNALEWMIRDGVATSVEVSAVLVLTDPTNPRVELSINIRRPEGGVDKFGVFWDSERTGLYGF